VRRHDFRLATVLRVRRAQEESARARLLRGNRRVQQAAESHDRSVLHYRMVPQSNGAVAATVFRRERAASDLAAATLAHAGTQLTSAQSQAAVARGQWQEAAQRVEALERLERRVQEDARVDAARTEANAVDELVTSRFIRTNGASAGAGVRP
jgi:flagellar FliJ protein